MPKLGALMISLVMCASSANAFHRTGGTTTGRRRTAQSPPTSSRFRGEPSSTLLFASRQFRNVEEMLDSFEKEMVLISFSALNCGPCRLQKKELASVSRSMGDLQMLAIDTNRWPSVTSRFEVAKLPCLVALREGQILFRIEGLTTAADVVERVRAVQ